MNVCRRHSEICRGESSIYRDVSVDFRSGGVVIYVNVEVGFYWQRVGVVVRLDDTRTRVYVAGVDVDGVVYDPASLPLGLDDIADNAIDWIERQGNELLREVAVEVNGEQFRLSDVVIDDTTVTLNLR